MDSGREQNYWPGFVDALSNVVLTLVFVLVIFVFALVMASNKVEEKMKQATEQADKTGQSTLQDENAELKKQLAAMTTELEQMRGKASAADKQSTGAVDQQAVAAENMDKQLVVQNQEQQKNQQGPVEVANAANSVTLSYPLAVADLDPKTSEQLGHVLQALQQRTGNHKILIKSYLGKETYTAAQRMAYYRAIGARNYLITKMGEAPDNISVSILSPPQPQEGRVEIIFEKK